MPTRTEWAYLAGYVDGDGCIGYGRAFNTSMQHYVYLPKITVKSVCPDAPRWMQSEFGGYLYCRSSRQVNTRPAYEWIVQSTAMRPLIEELEPYLLLKGPEVTAVLQHWQIRGGRWVPDPAARDAAREAVYQQVRELHRSRNNDEELLTAWLRRCSREEQLAYAAGLFDAEGCVSARTRTGRTGSRYHELSLVVVVTDRLLVLAMATILGGKTRLSHAETDAWAASYDWRRYGSDAVQDVRQLLPWLRTKRERAGVAAQWPPVRSGSRTPQPVKRRRDDLVALLTAQKSREDATRLRVAC